MTPPAVSAVTPPARATVTPPTLCVVTAAGRPARYADRPHHRKRISWNGGRGGGVTVEWVAGVTVERAAGVTVERVGGVTVAGAGMLDSPAY